MLRRLKVKIEQTKESQKNIVWELSTIDNLNLVKYKFEVERVTMDVSVHNAEFTTRLNKARATQVIASIFKKPDFDAFTITEIK